MRTIIEKINKATIRQAGDIIKNGGLVAFPTETVYGLGADALKKDASMKIYAAKGRPSDNPLIVHIAKFDALEKITSNIPNEARKLAKAFWPGPLTMIFQKSEEVPYETTGGLNTVAVRMPDNETALEIIRESGGYIAAPSANISGRPSPTNAAHVRQDMDGRIEMIIDGGDVGIGLESTIVDLTSVIPMILRPGYITEKMIADVIGQVSTDPAVVSEKPINVKAKAPGMKYKHYAPKADMMIIDGSRENVVNKINEIISENEKKGIRCGVICSNETSSQYKGGIIKDIGALKEEEVIARNLYRILREFDEEEVAYIYSETFNTPRMGTAIMNRLKKAAGYQIIKV